VSSALIGRYPIARQLSEVGSNGPHRSTTGAAGREYEQLLVALCLLRALARDPHPWDSDTEEG